MTRFTWSSFNTPRFTCETSGDGVPARVVSLSYVGATTRLGLEADGLRLHVTVPAGGALPEQGDEVMLTFNRDHLHVMKGDLSMPMPIILGHEGSGVIEAVGEGVTSVQPGDPVILVWRGSCGRCEYCANGRPALCDMGTQMRFTGTMPDGTTRFRNAAGESIRHYAGVSAFSTVSTMPEASVVKIPADISFEKAALRSQELSKESRP